MARETLLPQQKNFCDEFAANGGNGRKAAIAAGYKESDASSRADRLLKNPKAIAYLNVLMEKIDNVKVAKIEEIQAFWTGIVRGEIEDAGYPAKLADRIRASEILARSQGAFIEKLQVSGANGEALPTISLNFVKPE